MDQKAMKEATDQVNAFRRGWDARHAALPDTLYHYTDAEGLLGILESGGLWATEIRFLNDRSELVYALDRARAALESASGRHGLEFAKVRNWLGSSLGYSDGRGSSAGVGDQLTQLYVISFCTEGDDESLWEKYADKGAGVSIQFTRECLGKLRRVIYCGVEQRRVAEEWADAACAVYAAGGERTDANGPIEDLLLEFICSCKSDEHSNECEWRAVCIPQCKCQIRFRCKESVLVPYVELPFRGQGQDRPIPSITLGPRADRERTERSVRQVLFAKGYTQAVEVRWSAREMLEGQV